MPRPPMTRESVDALVALLRVVLAAEAGRAMEPPRLDVPEPDLIRAAHEHRVAPLLVERHRELGLPDSVVAALRPNALASTAAALSLAQRTAGLQQALAGAGIDSVAYKGVALALVTTGTINGRGGGDIDLLVRRDDVPRTHDALIAAGLVPVAPQRPAPGWWWSWMSWQRRELAYAGPRALVDLHWRIALDHGVLPPTAALLARAMEIERNGVALRTLSRPDTLAAACYTSYYDRYARLRNLVDIARLARDPAMSLPPGLTRRGRRLVASSVALVDALLGPLPPAPALGTPATPDPMLLRMWHEASLLPLWNTVDVPTGELAAMWRHHVRFANPVSATLMVAGDMVVKPSLLDPASPGGGLGSALRDEARDLVTRRLRRREPRP